MNLKFEIGTKFVTKTFSRMFATKKTEQVTVVRKKDETIDLLKVLSGIVDSVHFCRGFFFKD